MTIRSDSQRLPRADSAHPSGRPGDRVRRPADALPPPDGVLARDVRRSLDLEALKRAAPDLDGRRLTRVARVREELREGTYETEARLLAAVEAMLRDLL